MKRLIVLACAIAGLLGASCGDPVHDQAVADLGPETSHPGPEHRPGQPCLVCHGGSGPGNPQFSVAGTVYQLQYQTSDTPTDPAVGVTVSFADANGSTYEATTNGAGNFYVRLSDWAPAAPIRVKVQADGVEPTRMTTHIGRDGSCAGCHQDPPGPRSPGRVYAYADPSKAPGGSK